MLKLAPAAFGKEAARRLLMMRAISKRAVVEDRVASHAERNMPAAGGHAIPSGGDPNDGFVGHRSASAWGIASTRSSAIIRGPAISAARP